MRRMEYRVRLMSYDIDADYESGGIQAALEGSEEELARIMENLNCPELDHDGFYEGLHKIFRGEKSDWRLTSVGIIPSCIVCHLEKKVLESREDDDCVISEDTEIYCGMDEPHLTIYFRTAHPDASGTSETYVKLGCSIEVIEPLMRGHKTIRFVDEDPNSGSDPLIDGYLADICEYTW